MKRIVLIMLVSVGVLVFAGCGGDTVNIAASDSVGQSSNGTSGNDGVSNKGEITTVKLSGEGEDEKLQVVLSDGSVGGEELMEGLSIPLKNQESSSVDFTAETIEPGETDDLTMRWGIGRIIRRTKFSIRGETHDIISPCVNRKRVKHLNLEVQNVVSGEYKVKLSMMAWWNKGPKVAIWDERNKQSGYCVTTEGSYSKVKNAIYNALMEADFSRWSATVMAATGATMVMLVLIPAVVVA